MPAPADLLAAAVRRHPAAPLLTWYDDDRGERVEFSGTTFANWVAKTANLLQEEFDVSPGATVAMSLPVHWQTAVVLLATWSCGGTVLDTAAGDSSAAGADVHLVAQDRLEGLEHGAGQLVGLSLHPLGLGMTGYAGPARDFAVEVRASADVFVPWSPPRPDAVGLVVGDVRLSLGQLVDAAVDLSGRLRLSEEDRVLIDGQALAAAGPVAWLLAPLAAGASMVLLGHADPARLPGRASQERVTVTLGIDVPSVHRAGDAAGPGNSSRVDGGATP